MSGRHQGADLVIVGRIVTLRGDGGFGWVAALAITDGRVSAAGTANEIMALAGPRTRSWRLEADVVVMPSITDAHLHLLSAARAAGELDLDGLDRASVLAAVAATASALSKAGDPDTWITGHGWSLDAIAGEPTRTWLDEVAPDHPVALWSHDHHSRWLNTAALRASGLDAAADRPGGRIVRDEEGVPTGWLLEGVAGLPDASIPSLSEEATSAAIDAYAKGLAELGVTGAQDPGDLAPDPGLGSGPALYRRLAESGRLPLRVVGSLREEQLARGIEMGFRSAAIPAGSTPARYRDGWIKLFADGALGSRTAFLSSPYERDDPRWPGLEREHGLELRTRAELRHVVEAAAAAGIASQIHAIGDAATTAALDVLEGASPVPGVQHRIEHAQLIKPHDVARFGEAGIAASVQACHLLTDATAMRDAWGHRSGWAFPLASLAATGAALPAGTDAPVEPPDPWRGLSAAMTRGDASWPRGEAFHAEQSMGLARAIRSLCRDGPRSLGIDDEGHLGPGARADLIVVPSVLFDATPDAATIEAIRPHATLLDGRIVAQTEAFDP